ncbi:MAG: methyltransferase [Alterinioella nitratireducens]|uniref:methyltransferase n=1 Tax=Alterinioella nitratireducens TaxID=2735915 RepID=UPI00405A1DAA
MTPNRWTLALDSGDLAWPDGARSLVLRARGEADFSGLGAVQAVQGFYPDHARLTARGIDAVVAAEGQYGAALVQIVKSKPETLSLVAEAMARVTPGGVVAVDGQKTEGIESVLKAVRKLLPVDGVLSKSHGKLFWLTRPDTVPQEIADWAAVPALVEDRWITAPGMFSPGGPDAGSELLAALVPQLKGDVADLGAGWGFLAASVLEEQEGIDWLDLIEAEWSALEAARRNVTDPRARLIWDDATTHTHNRRYDAILSNPPFHTDRAADPGLGQAFIAAAARMLKPSGQFFMVANRHLPYEATLKAHFGTAKMLAEIGGYKLYQAGKPKTARRT